MNINAKLSDDLLILQLDLWSKKKNLEHDSNVYLLEKKGRLCYLIFRLILTFESATLFEKIRYQYMCTTNCHTNTIDSQVRHRAILCISLYLNGSWTQNRKQGMCSVLSCPSISIFKQGKTRWLFITFWSTNKLLVYYDKTVNY